MSSLGGPPPRGIQREGYQREQEHTELFVTNLPPGCSAEELRNYFGQYGVVKTVTIPRNHIDNGFTRAVEVMLTSPKFSEVSRMESRQKVEVKIELVDGPRGGRYDQYNDVASAHWKLEHLQRYGFVKFLNPGQAASALNDLDRRLFRGQEIIVQFAKGWRKTTLKMMAKEQVSSVTALPNPARISSPEPRGSAHSRSPSTSGSDFRRSDAKSWRDHLFPAEGGRAPPAGHDNHARDGAQGVVGSPADECRIDCMLGLGSYTEPPL